MSPTLESLGIDRLSVLERLELVQAILNSIAAEAKATPLTDAQLQGIDRRLAAHRANPHASAPWEQIEDETLSRIIRTHDLKLGEIVRLLRVLCDCEPAAQKQELEEELRCILAARELAQRPKLTNEVVDRARAAFESGRVPFVPQEMD